MPSYKQYRISRELPNGWNIRLDFVPYDVTLGSTLNSAIEELDAVCLLELGDQTCEFDDVPYGLCKPQTLKFKLAWSRLPAAVQTALETGYTSEALGQRVNTWILYSDRGTGGATWSVEFVGCEDNIESLELEPLDEKYKDGGYAYNVELVDICYHAMKVTTGYTALSQKQGAHRVPNDTPWQVWMEKFANGGRNQQHVTYGPVYCDHSRDVMVKLFDGLAEAILDNYVHVTPQPGDDSAVADATSTARDIFTAALELHGVGTGESVPPRRVKRTPDYSFPNVPSNDTVRPLLSTEIWLTTNVQLRPSNTTVGGIYASNDNYSWGRKDVSIYDIMRDLCETLGVKAAYRFNYVTKAGAETNDRITVTWYVKRIASSRDYANNVDTTDVTLDTNIATKPAKIIKRGDNILKSEVRFETSNSEDKTEIVRVVRGARASRSMNVEPIVHNIPVFLKEYNDTRGRWDSYKQTNTLFFKGRGSGQIIDGSIMKVHEDTLYWYGPKATQYVSVSSTASSNPEFQTDRLQQAYMVQLAALQAETSMAVALTKLHLKAFADNDNGIVEISFSIGTSPYVLCDALAGRHTLTGDVTTTFTTLAWDYALPASIKVNWTEGTSDIKYYLFKPTTAN